MTAESPKGVRTPRKRGRPRKNPLGPESSPTKTSEMTSETPSATPSSTPVKRVNRTPAKRSDTDLDRSARRRAGNAMLSRMLNEDDEEGILNEEEERIAEEIIKESRQSKNATVDSADATTDFGLDIEKLEEELKEELAENKNFAGMLFLDGSEGYFEQHRARMKISAHTMANAPNIDYQEYARYTVMSDLLHSGPRQTLLSLHQSMYSQWLFELTQGFSLLLYGVGSKRKLATDFVNRFVASRNRKVLCVNGYNPATNFKDILNMTTAQLLSEAEMARIKLPRVPVERLHALLKYMETVKDKEVKVVILCHNIDGESLRTEKVQKLFCSLVSLPQVWLIATVDHVYAPMMWDSAKMAQYNFVWHDATTFEPYTLETSFGDSISLGKTATKVGVEGVKYVLGSLTSNARALYRNLVSHQIEVMTEEMMEKGEEDEDPSQVIGTIKHGIEFQRLYQMCVEEFITSNEMNFRTMLTEFVEHKMAVSTKDVTGVEIIMIPFDLASLNKILEEYLLE